MTQQQKEKMSVYLKRWIAGGKHNNLFCKSQPSLSSLTPNNLCCDRIRCLIIIFPAANIEKEGKYFVRDSIIDSSVHNFNTDVDLWIPINLECRGAVEPC